MGSGEVHNARNYADAIEMANLLNGTVARACALTPSAPKLWAIPVEGASASVCVTCSHGEHQGACTDADDLGVPWWRPCDCEGS